MVALKPLIDVDARELRAGFRPFVDIGQRLGALARATSFERSSHIRARQKLSSPSSISRVRMPSTSVTTAPADSNAFAAFTATSRTSFSSAWPTPASSIRPMRSLRGDLSSAFQLMSSARQAHAVAAVGLRQHAHHQRGIVDGAGHRPGDAADIGRIDRNAPEARLQRDQAAPAGRQPHRAADVGAEMQRAVAGRSRGARAGRLEPPGFLLRSQGLRVRGWKLDRPDDSMP